MNRKFSAFLSSIFIITFILYTCASTTIYASQKNNEKPIQPEFGPYMKKMQKAIKANWVPPKGEESKRVILLYTIQKNGKVKNIRVSQSSGDKNMDNAAIKSLKNTAPFDPLPNTFKGDHVDIQFTFDYNVWK